MRIGVVTPGTDRGLGIQSWEAARNLDASVLLVETKDPSAPTHHDRFPDATVVPWVQGLDPRIVIPWLRTVDVVYAAETFYDPRFCRWARANDTTTVLHANPEFWTGQHHPDVIWTATPWRRDVMPPETQVVPFPVALDRFDYPEGFTRYDDRTRWVHVAGKRALADRNGTDLLMAALPLLEQPCHVTIYVQHGERPALPDTPPHVSVYIAPSVPANYWDLYVNQDAMVLPRRYGGLCLPVQEAMAAGLAVLMPDVAPNDVWPTARVPAEFDRKVTMPCGRVPTYAVNPAVLASAMDQLADPALLGVWQEKSRVWARAHSWEALRPMWLSAMEGKVAA